MPMSARARAGRGAYDCGDFGFLPIANLSLAQTSQSIGVAQADDEDLPVVVLSDPEDENAVIGALCSGAQARITSYTQTDYVQISLGTLVGYVKKSQIRVLTTPDEPLSDRIPQRATAKTDADIRVRPEVKADTVESIAAGTRVYMLGKFGDWAYVLAGDSPSLDVTAKTVDRAGFVRLAALNAPASTHAPDGLRHQGQGECAQRGGQPERRNHRQGAHGRAAAGYGLRQQVDGHRSARMASAAIS